MNASKKMRATYFVASSGLYISYYGRILILVISSARPIFIGMQHQDVVYSTDSISIHVRTMSISWYVLFLACTSGWMHASQYMHHTLYIDMMHTRNAAS